MKQTNNQSGFTLAEILIAVVIVSFGLLAMSTFLGNYVQKNGQNEHRTMATVLAEEKIEELRTKALGRIDTNSDFDLVAADSDTVGVAIDADGNVLGATGTSGEIYTLTWSVEDTNNPHTITATVTWDGIGNSQVVLMTMVNDDN